jgi:hypothetical protein
MRKRPFMTLYKLYFSWVHLEENQNFPVASSETASNRISLDACLMSNNLYQYG